MFRKFLKTSLLVGLSLFYIQSVSSNPNGWFDAVILDTVNWIMLVIILYLASDYINALGITCILVLALGIFVQGYRFYTVQFPSTQIERTDGDQPSASCRDENASWYAKLSGRCYR